MNRNACSAMLFAALGLLVSCTGDDESATDPINLPDTVVGRCVDFPADSPDTVEAFPYTECDVAHSHEIFAVITNPAREYPGFEALEEYAQVECLAAFDDYVGISAFDSTLFYSWIVPSLGSWNSTEKDRQVVCVAGSGDGRDLIGSVKGTRI